MKGGGLLFLFSLGYHLPTRAARGKGGSGAPVGGAQESRVRVRVYLMDLSGTGAGTSFPDMFGDPCPGTAMFSTNAVQAGEMSSHVFSYYRGVPLEVAKSAAIRSRFRVRSLLDAVFSSRLHPLMFQERLRVDLVRLPYDSDTHQWDRLGGWRRRSGNFHLSLWSSGRGTYGARGSRI